MIRRDGPGRVPAIGLVPAALKQLGELPCESMLASGHLRLALDFRRQGLEVAEVEAFFAEALRASKKQEPTIESGNKYGVSDDFHALNGRLLAREYAASPRFAALDARDRERLAAFLDVVLHNPDLRNRNPLHPAVLDSVVIGNLVNFPKHVFNFPLGSYATDGRESLSLCLYGYSLLQKSKTVAVVGDVADVAGVAKRLGVAVVAAADAKIPDGVACVVVGFNDPALGEIAAKAQRAGVAVHVHVNDASFRNIFAARDDAVNFVLPDGVRSASIEEGLFLSGFSLYRDVALRDAHFDVGYAWQTAYLSPNEGGSGASTPLYVDFCVACLGWAALSALARAGGSDEPATLEPSLVGANHDVVSVAGAAAAAPADAARVDVVASWAASVFDDASRDRAWCEAELVAFQRHFLGGKDRDVEALTTGGGTRSINLALEAVLARAAAAGAPAEDVKVLTGNPHLAVERAERRFGFALERLEDRGALDVARLPEALKNPKVRAVFAQTLSYTDGISDDVAAVVDAVAAENARRRPLKLEPVTFINDCCLAFCVLVHNDGADGSKSYRALDLTVGRDVPTIVTLDAHKHLGTDKGVSTVVGTPGTLAHLRGFDRVGARPTRGHLIRALADVLFVGVAGYYRKYRELAAAVKGAERALEAAGARVVHGEHRVRGSTVLAVYAPASVLTARLKKRGHSTAFLYNLHPEDAAKCQYGWALSLTPHCLRKIDGDRSALDVFLADAVACVADAKLRGPFAQNSLAAILLNGGCPEPYLFSFLWNPGPGRALGETVLRRLFSLLLDAGVARSDKRTRALPVLAGSAVAALAALAALRKRRA